MKAAGAVPARRLAAVLLGILAAAVSSKAQVTPIFTNAHPQPASVLTQLQGSYYNNISLSGTPVLVRNESTINYDWGLGSPDPLVNVDNFSVRWHGYVAAPFSGTYYFYSVSDDGIRVWFNGNLIIDSWVDQGATEHASGPVNLTANTLYELQVEYYEHPGDAVAKLSWSGPNIGKSIVGSVYYPSVAGDQFGLTLSSFGSGQFAVGAPSADVLAFGTIYPDDGRVWVGDATGVTAVDNNSPGGFSSFYQRSYGSSLSARGDGSLVIGAPLYYGGSGFTGWITNMGTVYYGGGTMADPSRRAQSFFGTTVAGLTGNQWAASSQEGSGRVYLFSSGTLNTTIQNPGTDSAANFATAIAPMGTNRVLISSPYDSVAGDNAGSVYIYDLSGNQIRKIHNTGGKNGDKFGACLKAVDEHRFLIGVPYAAQTYIAGGVLHTNATAGVVYLYDDTGTRLQTIKNPDLSVGFLFGTSVAMLGSSRILVGSPGDKVGVYNNAGRAFLYNINGLLLESIDNPIPESSAGFGWAVCALDDRRFVVGAPNANTFDFMAGAIYGFDAPIPSAVLGAEILPPENLDVSGSFLTQGPAVSPAGSAFWHVQSRKLFAVKPGAILVTWPLLNGQVYNWQAAISWPTNSSVYQVHVAGQTPVNLSSGGTFSNVVLEATTTDADPAAVASNRVFSAQVPGTSFLMLSSGDPSSNAIRFQFVRSIDWSDPAYLYDHAPATIGQPIADPAGFHDPAAGSPQVVLASGAYCPAPVFDPAARSGAIIPVNQRDPGNPAHDLVVAFYHRGTQLYDPVTGLSVSNNIYWPYQPVRFEPQWPTNAQHLVVASTQGTGVIDPTQYVNWALYYQNDPSQPGFNPNDEHALALPYSGGTRVFALRSDLGTPQTSQPFVMIRYQDPAAGGQWRMKLWQVISEEAPWFFNYPAQAGLLLQAPFPLSALPPSTNTVGVSGPFWEDRKLSFWAKAAGNDGGSADIVMHYFYQMQPSFFFPGTNPPPVGSSVPLLDVQAGTPGTPIDVHFTTTWPSLVPTLNMGETLVKPKHNLPDISSQSSVQIVYQQAQALGQGESVKLIDPTREYDVALAQLPPDLGTTTDDGVNYFFSGLPPHLHDRLWYDKTAHLLRFKGQFIQPPLGEYYLLLNVLTSRDLSTVLGLSTDVTFQGAVNALAALVTDVTQVPPDSTGFDSMALTAGLAKGGGYVTLAFGNSTILSPPDEPVSLAIIQVGCPQYRGEVKVIESPNLFDEKLTLRHSGDFAGKADSYVFEWRTLPPVNGLPSTAPPDQWASYPTIPGNGQGAVDITIQGPGLFTLSDNFFICRYHPVTNALCTSPTNTLGWSDWTDPMFAPGWLRRVHDALNPFDQRKSTYGTSQPNTIVSMISQAGKPYNGPVALSQQNADQFGLIETYETVLRRGESFSINAAPPVNYDPANIELLTVAGQLSDLYMLLANEAYADAEDPTVAIGTDNQTYGAEATSIHCFQGQTASLMEEELDLLRGRDNSKLPSVHTGPVYNRLPWNFTRGIDGGEVAYALNYNIRAQDGSVPGSISAADAAALYPQGHGDAWGHYLSAIKNYYRLLRNPNFTWAPQIETVLVGGGSVSVGYEHERKFAAAAAARARAGAEIVNLTYRNAYVEDPAGQWQGYTDTDTNRAWGLAEWGSRAGQGAFFDWVTANALLPAVDSDPTHTGIQKIDRTTVSEIKDIVSALGDVQTKVDEADGGLNPLGLAKNVVPFDIDPNLVSQGQTHFEQIYSRAVTALNNAIAVFNRANNCTQLLRQQSDQIANFQQTIGDKENDFNSRLIEVFGYPYGDDIGPTGAYPTGYNGPDIYHYDYVDASQITGEAPPPTQNFTTTLKNITVLPDGSLYEGSQDVAFTISAQDLGFVKPANWTLPRRAPGQIQLARSDLLQTYGRFIKAVNEYKNLIAQIEDTSSLLQMQYDVNQDEITILNNNLHTQISLNRRIIEAHATAYLFDRMAKAALQEADAVAEAMPKATGLATDVTAPMRGAAKQAGSSSAQAFAIVADLARGVELVSQQDKEIASLASQIKVTIIKNNLSFATQESQLEALVRQESSSRMELFTTQEALQQAMGRYSASVASGERLLEDRLRFRQETAAQIQQYRYKDMAFRIFRNDALQKYRAQFDLAAMYVYLAARAYDFETNLKKGDPRGPGSDFMTSIIRSRALGIIQNGLPQTGPASGDGGLADPMARLNLNWQLVLKGELGFNNPQTETGQFSLRSELFRVQPGFAGNKTWRDTLSRCVVDNVLTVPEFKRFCIPFQPQQPVEPALVIPFATTINFGQNFFGWPLGAADHSYDSTHFATKVRSVGVWFANYNATALSSTPHVYLIPVGEDVMRSPSSNVGDIRQWKILDQALPVPFPLSSTSLNDPAWVPGNELIEQLEKIRQYPEFRAYNDSGTFDSSQVISNNRLIGRSVWNTRWLLIIPAGELLSDRNEGLQRFINGSLLLNGTRDGNGVTDIKIFFQTYAYSGN